jgi:hypothetical protein
MCIAAFFAVGENMKRLQILALSAGLLMLSLSLGAQTKPSLAVLPISGSEYDGKAIAGMISGSGVILETFNVQNGQSGAAYTISGTIKRSESTFRLTLILSAGSRKISEASIDYRDIVEVPASIPYLSRQLAGGIRPALLANNFKPEAEGNFAPQITTVPEVVQPKRESSRPVRVERERPAAIEEEKPARERPPRAAPVARERPADNEEWKNQLFYSGAWIGYAFAFPGDHGWAWNPDFLRLAGGGYFDWAPWKYLNFRLAWNSEIWTFETWDFVWSRTGTGHTGGFGISVGPNFVYRWRIFEFGAYLGFSYMIGRLSFNTSPWDYMEMSGIFSVLVEPQIGVKLGPGLVVLNYRISFDLMPVPHDLKSSAIGIGYKIGYVNKKP